METALADFGDWSTTPASNALTAGVNIGENCPAANMNNWGREIMAQLRSAVNPVMDDFLASTSLSSARSALGVASPTSNTSLTNLGNLTNTANYLPYMTGSDAWAKASFPSFGRSLVASGDAATALALLGVTGGAGSGSFSASSGYITLPFGSTTFKIVWIDGTASANGNTTISYPSTFTSWSRAICAGGSSSDFNAQNNNPVVTSTSTTGATVTSARTSSTSVTVLAWGV